MGGAEIALYPLALRTVQPLLRTDTRVCSADTLVGAEFATLSPRLRSPTAVGGRADL
jgi:hypothetical protein